MLTVPPMAIDGIESVLWRHAIAGYAACAEAFFPENDYGAPDWRQTDMVTRAEEWWRALPPSSRGVMLTAFASVELGTPVLRPGFRRFSRLPPEDRRALVTRWRASSIVPLRFLGDALKSATTMIYLSHPLAMKYIGVKSTACEPPTTSTPYHPRPHVPFPKEAQS